MAKRGKLIVFEGVDGSGKTTQAKLLLNYFKKNKILSAYISFPRYDKPWGKMVRRFLDGDFGKNLDPYLASMLYAGDRMAASKQINEWLNTGKFVVCNRYVGSNIGHMAGKVKSQKSKVKIIKWLEELEYKENKIPKEDVVILLSVPIKITEKLMKNRKLDIHEKDLKYQSEVLKVYAYVAGTRKNWAKVDCSEGGKILSPGKIHEKVVAIVNQKLRVGS